MTEFLIEVPAMTIRVSSVDEAPPVEPPPLEPPPVDPPPDPPPPPADPVVPGEVGTVNDLALRRAEKTSLTFEFHGTHDGMGNPANHELRLHLAGQHWGEDPIASRVLPAVEKGVPQHIVTIAGSLNSGLAPDTEFVCRVIAYRGTLNVNAVFGKEIAEVLAKTLEV